MILSAIDIGSNAARLLITEVTLHKSNPSFKKLTFVRVPIRLGFDVFEKGYISKGKEALLIHTLKAFQHLQKAFQVEHSATYATSAMRDAENSTHVIQSVRKETGIHIRLLTGDQEAQLVFENHIENTDRQKAYLFIDVGGGSTELCLFHQKTIIFKESFNIGTIRLLKEKVTPEMWDEMKVILKKYCDNFHQITAIGSGGNINKVADMSGIKTGKALPLSLLKDYYQQMKDLSVDKRIIRFHLKSDRADVIVPALKIYLQAMKWAGSNEILVPKIGLADGIVQHLYEQFSHGLKKKSNVS